MEIAPERKNTKEAIVFCAIRLFGTYGYGEVSIRQIAATVGIKGGSIYNHFQSKSEILEHIIDYYQLQMQRYFPCVAELKKMADTSSPAAVLSRYNYRYPPEELDIMLHLHRIVFSEQFNHEKLSAYLFHELVEGQINDISEVLTYLMDLDKIPRRNPRSLATLWVHTMLMLAMRATHYAAGDLAFYQKQDEYDLLGQFIVDYICGKTSNFPFMALGGSSL